MKHRPEPPVIEESDEAASRDVIEEIPPGPEPEPEPVLPPGTSILRSAHHA